MKMPPQIIRLVLLTIAIVGSYLAARSFLTPASFREYGFYRGNALEEIANSRQQVFGGRKACEECHTEQYAKLIKHEHKTLSCEGCHGPAAEHADTPDNPAFTPKKEPFSSCVRCHEFNPSRPKWHHQIVLKAHYPGQKCTECHVPHMPLEVP